MILANISHIRGANLEFSIQVLMLFSPLLSDVGVLIFECHENVTKKKELNRRTEITPEQAFLEYNSDLNIA